jgi:RNA polymerase sigma factor (sigma-70 family)
MKINEPTAETVAAATRGDLAALDALLAGLQPGVFHLALRMLGQREDAADATQEILLKVVTHLSAFRGEAAFATWVWRIARNHLLSARTRIAESPEQSLEALDEKLATGLSLADRIPAAGADAAAQVLTPQQKLEARQVAVSCTQSMLMALDREQRLAYLMDTVFDLDSAQAAEVLGVSAAAYRQRLSRARARLEGFMAQRCGLVNAEAHCRCDTQARVLRQHGSRGAKPALLLQPVELAEAERTFAAYGRVADAAAVFRSLPELRAPERLRAAIRLVLTQEGFLDRGAAQ